MPRLTRRQFMAHVSAGATAFGLSHILNPNKALATTPDMVTDMLAGQEPKQGGILTLRSDLSELGAWPVEQGRAPVFLARSPDPLGLERADLGR